MLCGSGLPVLNSLRGAVGKAETWASKSRGDTCRKGADGQILPKFSMSVIRSWCFRGGMAIHGAEYECVQGLKKKRPAKAGTADSGVAVSCLLRQQKKKKKKNYYSNHCMKKKVACEQASAEFFLILSCRLP